MRVLFQHAVGQRLDLPAVDHLNVDALQRQRVRRDHRDGHHRAHRKHHRARLVRQAHHLPRALLQRHEVVHRGAARLGVADEHGALRVL